MNASSYHAQVASDYLPPPCPTHMVLVFISAFIGLQLINFGMSGEFGVGFGMFILD